MRYTLLLVLMISCFLTFCSAQDAAQLNVKEGLWEQTVTHSMSGMPSGAANISPDMLAKLPPDQRAKVEAMMSGRPTTDVHKQCVTKEKLQKNAAFGDNRGDCTRTVISSNGRHLEAKFHCQEKDAKSDGNIVIDALGSDNVKGSVHIVTTSEQAHNMTMDFTFTSKYLGPSCGDVK
ncbi:MAG: DUF3617 domain-containing protein [Terriglobales bacterium]